jgi:hypothetical protein
MAGFHSEALRPNYQLTLGPGGSSEKTSFLDLDGVELH